MSTLSSVVSNLVRAQMGSSVSTTVPDDDLDRHVAELILKEAKQKLEKYSKDGIRAYLPQPDSNAPKTNKRFLSSIIRSTDDHNKTILRTQALAAQEVRQERMEQERLERKARAEEAAEAERMRRLMGRGGTEWADNWDRGEKRESRMRGWERDDDSVHGSAKGKERADRDGKEERRSRRYSSRSPDREGRGDARRKHRRERSYSRTPSPTRSTDSSYDRRRERREHRRSHHHRSRRSRSRDDHATATSPARESGRRKHERSRRHHRDTDRRSRSPRRSADGEQPRSKSTSSPAEEPRAKPDSQHRSSGKQYALDSRSPSPVRKSHPESPIPRSEKRKRSPSPVVGPPPLPSMRSDDAEEEVQPLSKVIVGEGTPSRSALHSSRSTPKTSRASSKLQEAVETASSSRTLLSTRAPSSSPASHSDPPPPPASSTRSRPRSRTRTKGKAAPPQPPSSPPPLPAHLPSKMDKYFDASYDPRLDVAPLTLPNIPKTGLISDAEFAGWDAMLDIIRQRREDKEEKKRLERWGLGADKDRDKKKQAGAEGTSGVVDIMAIEYKKRGSVREWDLGKEGF